MSGPVDPNLAKSPLDKTLTEKDEENPSEKEGSGYGRRFSIGKGEDMQGISPLTVGSEQRKEEPRPPSNKIVPLNLLEERIGDMESLTVEEESLEGPKRFVSAFPPRYTGPLTSEKFPFRETFFLTQQQKDELKIQYNGTSEVPEFKESFFTSKTIISYGEDGSQRDHNYIVTRYPSKEEREIAIEKRKLQENVDPLVKFDPANATVYSESAQKKLQGKRVILTTDVVGGFGDISCVIKMANHMKSLGVDPKDILVIIPSEKTSSFVVGKQDFTILWGPLNGSVQKEINDFSPDLVVMAPVLNDTLLNTIKFAGGNSKVIQIQEYDGLELALGFGKGKLGGFLEQREYLWSLSKLAQTSVGRLTQLESVSKEIQQATLGGFYSKEAVEEFDKTSELFFGYSSNQTNGQQDFAVSVTKMMYMEKSEKEPCIFLMGNALMLYELLEERMMELGVHEIEILHRFEPDKPFTKSIITLGEPQAGETKRRVKLIQGPVKKEDVRFLIRASDNRVGMGTGDQSASEMFWKLVYETLDHKRRVLIALEEIATEINPEFGRLFKNTHKDDENARNVAFDSAGLADFFYAVRNDPAMQAAQLAMARKISQECSFGPKFHFLLDQLLEDTKEKKQAA